MTKNLLIVFLAGGILFSSCNASRYARTAGDPKNAQEIGYHPLDPLPVEIMYDDTVTNDIILKALPDETMRLAVGQFNSEGGLSFGGATVGYKGNSYMLTLDYIKFTTNSIGVSQQDSAFTITSRNPESIVPVYVGVGLRLTAHITVLEGKVDLGDLFALGAAASAKKISGTLVLQTLGISGESVSASIPFPSEINSNSIQNAILALGSIKAKIYDESTSITPRVVGVYNTLGGGTKTINAFIGALLNETQLLDVRKYE